MSLTLIGLGVKEGDVSLSAYDKILSADKVILKTDLTENYPFFLQKGIPVVTMDGLYKKSRNFDTLCKNVASEVLSLSEGLNAVYCVDGSVLEDNACKLILKKRPKTQVISGISKVTSALEGAKINGGYSAVSAYDLSNFKLSGETLCVYDIDSAYLAGEVKLKLMETYGDECPCHAFYGDEHKVVPLYELDQIGRFDYTTRAVVIPNEFLKKEVYDFYDLYYILKMLRAENGCPWDRAQTHESIRTNAIEEVYELVDAIDNGDDERLTEEIGDVLMQAVFHTQLGEDRGALTGSEVTTGVCKKLISRHTHIFFGDSAKNESEALDVWEKNKQKEHGFTLKQAVLDVPKSFPALMRAQKAQKRGQKAGWDCGDKQSEIVKINSLVEELCRCENSEITRVSGDLLFVVANYIRLFGGDAEIALKDKTEQFIKEFDVSDER